MRQAKLGDFGLSKAAQILELLRMLPTRDPPTYPSVLQTGAGPALNLQRGVGMTALAVGFPSQVHFLLSINIWITSGYSF